MFFDIALQANIHLDNFYLKFYNQGISKTVQSGHTGRRAHSQKRQIVCSYDVEQEAKEKMTHRSFSTFSF